MNMNSGQQPMPSLPPAEPSNPQVSAQPAFSPSTSVPESTDPKQLVAQYAALAEEIIMRNPTSPRVQANELAALKSQYLQTRFGVAAQAKVG